MSTLEVILTAFSAIFGFWPLYLLNAFSRRGNIFRKLLVVWGFWAVVRIVLAIAHTSPVVWFIPEPLSTWLFFLSGAVVGGAWGISSLWQRRTFFQKAQRISVDDLLEMSPREFEEMVAALYQAMGHRAKRVGQRGDHGVDVLVKAKNGEKWIVQCKRWRKPVGEAIVRDFYGTLQHEKADQGAIIATKGFTQAAKTWAKGKPIKLYSGEDFLRAWRRVTNSR